MKKSLLLILMILTAVLPLGSIHGEPLESGDFTYEILSNGTAEITGFTGEAREVDVPAIIDGLPVAAIGSSAFTRALSIETINLPESVLYIGDAAFAENTGLRSISLPESLRSMGDLVFQGCTKLETVTLPAGLVHIGWNPFDRCSEIAAIEFSGDNPFYTTEDGVLFDTRNGVLLSYPYGKQDVEYELPEWVTKISMAAFSENPFLRSITIHQYMEELEGNPFCGCTGLEQVNISMMNPIFEVRSNALYNKQTRELISLLWGNSKDSYSVPNGTVSIAREAFYKHTELTSVTLPKSLTKIDDAAFAESGLVSIEIPDSVVSLGNSTFSSCAGLRTVTLPSGLTWIGNSAFYECTALESIELPQSLTTIGAGAFMSCEKLTEVKIPENMHFIGDFAFALCTGLRTVDFPARLFSIGRGAFYGAEGLTASVYPDSLAEDRHQRRSRAGTRHCLRLYSGGCRLAASEVRGAEADPESEAASSR